MSVPSRAMRAGQALSAIASPTASGHAWTIGPSAASGPKRATWSRTASPMSFGCQPPVREAAHAARASPGVTSITAAGSGPPRGSASAVPSR